MSMKFFNPQVFVSPARLAEERGKAGIHPAHRATYIKSMIDDKKASSHNPRNVLLNTYRQFLELGPEYKDLHGQEIPNVIYQNVLGHAGISFLTNNLALFKAFDYAQDLNSNQHITTTDKKLVDAIKDAPEDAKICVVLNVDSKSLEHALYNQTDLSLYVKENVLNTQAMQKLGYEAYVDQLSLHKIPDAGSSQPVEMAHLISVSMITSPNLKAHSLDRDDYVKYLAFCVRLQCEHALKTNANKLFPDALNASDVNPYLVAAVYRMVLNEPPYKDIQAQFNLPRTGKYLHELQTVFQTVFTMPANSIHHIVRRSAIYPEDAPIKSFGPNEVNTLNKKLAEFNKLLSELRKHAEHSLRPQGYQLEADLANDLYWQLLGDFTNFLKKVNDHQASQEDIDNFKQKIKDHIQRGQCNYNNQQYRIYDCLAKHRGIKRILADIMNVFLHVASLGVGAGIKLWQAKKQNKPFDWRFFEPKTKSQRCINEIQNSADVVERNMLPAAP